MDMGRPNSFRAGLRIRTALLLVGVSQVLAQSGPGTQPLKLLISIEQQSIAAPLPARITLHLHNAGQRPLWLYRKARDASTTFRGDAARLESNEHAAAYTTGGATIAVRLDPAEAREGAVPAEGTVLD